MSDKRTYPANEAMLVARELLDTLRPACKTLAIAGSLRRRKVRVADIEIVFVPLLKPGVRSDDFFNPAPEINQAEEVIQLMLDAGTLDKRPNSLDRTAWGLMNKLAIHKKSGIPVDLFTATQENFYNYLVCRTGPSDSNIAICQAAIAKGWHWKPYGSGFSKVGDYGGKHPDKICTTEREVFEFVGLPYKEPWDR